MDQQSPSFDIQTLDYYQNRAARRTLISRVVLLTMIFGMLAANMWLTERNYKALVINVDQALLAQDQLHEQTTARLEEMEGQLGELQLALERMEASQETVEIAAVQ